MNFQEWLRLDEIQHVSFPEPMSINGIRSDSIDFRFEDWKQGYNQDRRGTQSQELSVPLIPSGQRFFTGSFSAPLKTGQWLNVNRESGPATHGALALAVATQPQVQIAKVAEHQPLPDIWFDFAVLYLGNYVVKAPEWPRHKSEMQAAHVAQLDPVQQ